MPELTLENHFAGRYRSSGSENPWRHCFMNKGYAFGFLLVLLIVILGLYVAFTGFMASREAQRVQSGPELATPVVLAPATEVPPSPSPSPGPTMLTLPTLVPGLTATLTAMVVPTDVVPAQVTEPVEGEPTELAATEPPPAMPTDTPQPQLQPPTPAAVPAFLFRLAGPPTALTDFASCCYILGTVRDAAGNALEGVQVQVSTTWTPPVISTSKGGVDLGKYDIPIGYDAVTWTVFLVDVAGNQISSQVQIPFDPAVANAYRVDWARTY